MPVFLCRWPNGDVSIVAARNNADAIDELDEFGNADHAEIFQLKEFLVDFRLNDEGHFELNQFGEGTRYQIMAKAFPLLDKTLLSEPLNGLDEHSGEHKSLVRSAVELERTRLGRKKRKVKLAKTELGKRLQEELGAASVVADRAVEHRATEVLKNFKGNGSGH